MTQSSLYIILEPTASRTGTTFSAGMISRPREALPARLVVDELTEVKAAAFRTRPEVRIARAMPVTLVRPVPQRSPVSQAKAGWGVSALGADDDCPYDGDGVVISVLDTGINAEHPSFNGMEILAKDFTGTGLQDRDGHGTHCAATIFGRSVDGIRIGVAPGIRNALIAKVIGGDGADGTARVCQAIHWSLTNGAHIISMSLGFDFASHTKNLLASGFPDQIAYARALEDYRDTVRVFDSLSAYIGAQRSGGALVVAAAGNESLRHIDRTFSVGVAPPANAPGLISVGALARDGTVAGFSNHGVTLCAPGVEIVSADVTGGLISMSGTSMAAPHVSGLAALWVQHLLERGVPWSAERLRNELVRSCSDVNQPAQLVGMGMPRAPSKGSS